MRTISLVVASLMLVAACSEQPVAPAESATRPELSASHGPVVHGVVAGTPDICGAFGARPGCDGNWSLAARQYADGTVEGEFQDVWGGGGQPGIHAVIDCIHIQPAPNPAFTDVWVSGTVTSPAELAGLPMITRARDRGTSSQDPDDFVGLTFVDPVQNYGVSADCRDHPLFGFAPSPGQVRIW